MPRVGGHWWSEVRHRLERTVGGIARTALAAGWGANALRVMRRKPYDALVGIGKAELMNTLPAEMIAGGVARLADWRLRRQGTSWRAAVCGSDAVATMLDRFAPQTGLWDLLHANVIVLKSYRSTRERGVLLIKYTEVLNAFPILFDLPAVQRRYHLALEPSTTAYLQPSTRLICPTEGVITVQAVEPSAQRAYRQLGFVPIDVSDGDWVDEEVFRPLPGTAKRYDAIMVSNFIPWKRHEFLFRALRDHGLGDSRVALVASSHVGLGVDWARRLLASYGLRDNVEIFLDISQERVNELLNASRCHVLCSLREGANRSCLEALFAGIPVLIDARHIGFPHWRFPASVVRTFSDEAALADELRRVRGGTDGHDISSIAGSIAGARVATAKLEDALRVETEARGESWTASLTPKVTRVHCCYRNATDFDQHAEDYEFLQTVTSSGFAYDPERARTLLTR